MDNNYIDNLIKLYLTAIDNQNKNEFENLFNKNKYNSIEKDIVLEMYNSNQLNSKRFQFIIENCSTYLNISSILIKLLMKNNHKELLEILFKKHLKFYDNEIIINLLTYYKNKIPISKSVLHQRIDNDKYKLSIKLDKRYLKKYDKSYYLFNVCESGNEPIVRYLIKHGADINIKAKYGETPLFYACASGNENLVKYLIELGADINEESKFGETPLIEACRNGNEQLIKYLVEHGADINKENIYGETPLFYICASGNENLVKYLIEFGADINKETNDGSTLILYACSSGNKNLVKYLIEQGLDINKKIINPVKHHYLMSV